ncbi:MULTISPECIES: hypothetical protein [Gammaproteobacteria]|nr:MULTISPECIES: hypothetical protein [Gammaproteobacteria]MBK5300968.1 hypothetical protein [Bacillus sp. TH86]MBK5320737.1 hypothetical protein [Bacillus sp. TH59]MBK5335687.1 hypothetical protein [Bacillus sp. TH57]MBK5309764.1 hypothetical protein [Pseudomonas sp. TH71]MBK5315236.1 hypothetical protein [Erwinia sp. TH79]
MVNRTVGEVVGILVHGHCRRQTETVANSLYFWENGAHEACSGKRTVE